MQTSSKQAFTMVELIFVIVVIGILAAVAVPKLAATRDDAEITKAINTLSSVRSALATERQKRLLRGNTDALTSLGGTTGTNKNLFEYFDNNATAGARVLEYPVRSCSSASARGCWIMTGALTYDYRMPHNGNDVGFTVNANSFRMECDSPTDADCITLTK